MGMMTENTGGGGKKHSKLRRQEAVAGWLFVLPAVIFWLVWFLYPAVKVISISFFQKSSLPENRRSSPSAMDSMAKRS